MAVAPFEHPFLSGLLGDHEMRDLLAAEAELSAMVRFEIALARAEAEHGVIPGEAASAIARALDGFRPDMAALTSGTARDGVVVPELVRQMRHAVGEPHGEHVHLGATSQDVVDTALCLRLKPVLELLDTRLADIVEGLEGLSQRFGGKRLMAHTRMQPAIPIRVADRIESWRAPLARHRSRLSEAGPALLALQFGGAAGTLEKLGGKGAAIRKSFAGMLDLADVRQWQSQRDRVAEAANLLSLITGSLGKFGQDVALLAQGGGEIAMKGGGGSSAMPHKQNPVAAEILVTLARFNATQIAGIHHAMVHEQERSGAAWTLEWLILPQVALAAGAATKKAAELIGNIDALGT